MSTVERFLEEARAKKVRWDAARAAVLALPAVERGPFLAELMLEAEAQSTVASKAAPKAVTSNVVAEKTEGTFVDRAERLVLGYPEGISTPDVGKIIGQPTANADGTLRQIMESRKTIERRDGKWFPIASASPKDEKKTNREVVIAALKSSTEPLGAADIFERVVKIKPDAKKPSIDSELNRMREDGLLEKKGSGPRGGLYGLTEGGGNAATAS